MDARLGGDGEAEAEADGEVLSVVVPPVPVPVLQLRWQWRPVVAVLVPVPEVAVRNLALVRACVRATTALLQPRAPSIVAARVQQQKVTYEARRRRGAFPCSRPY